jgi:hypothetical protein
VKVRRMRGPQAKITMGQAHIAALARRKSCSGGGFAC